MTKILVVVYYKDSRPKAEKRFSSLVEMSLQISIAKYLASLNLKEIAKVELIPE